MHVISSSDGTRIAFWQSGAGPPLLLVHGTTADHTTTWRSVLPLLEQRFTVYAMDRRGRGSSGDSLEYEPKREAEDVAAVVDAISAPVNVLGHSQGALYALEGALLTKNVRRLVLYEGVPLQGASEIEPRVTQRMTELLGAGDVEGALIAMLREVGGLAPKEIETMRAQHVAWQVRLGNARTISREVDAYARYTFVPERFRTMRTPTLFLVGSDSPDREAANARGVADGLPRARVATLPGQQHIAMHTAPELFVDVVTKFLQEP